MANRRPRPRLHRRKNLHREYLAAARTIARDIAGHRGVVGIVLSGGVARGYADRYSEIDLTIFLTPAAHDRWVKQLQAPVSLGDTICRGRYCDFDFENIREFRHRPLTMVERWDLSYARILHDPRGTLAALLERKIPLRDREVQDLLDFHDSWSRVWWFPDVARTWVRRGDVLAAHVVLNLSLQGVLETLFVMNGELIPYDKWIGHLFRDLAWTPRNFERNFRAALQVRELSTREVNRRASLIEGLGKQMDEGYRRLPSVPVEERKVLRWIFEKKRFNLREYRRVFPHNPRTLLEDPAAKIIRRRVGRRDVSVELDLEAVRRLTQDGSSLTPWTSLTLREVYATTRKEAK